MTNPAQSPLSPILTSSGQRFGKSDLTARLRGWLLDERVRRIHAKAAGSSEMELALIARDLPKMTPYGVSKVILWLLKNRLTRLAIARTEIKAGAKRADAKADLRGLAEWATDQLRAGDSGLILPN